jgi:hypothetical protein
MDVGRWVREGAAIDVARDGPIANGSAGGTERRPHGDPRCSRSNASKSAATGGVPWPGSGGRWGRKLRHGESQRQFRPQLSHHRPRSGLFSPMVGAGGYSLPPLRWLFSPAFLRPPKSQNPLSFNAKERVKMSLRVTANPREQLDPSTGLPRPIRPSVTPRLFEGSTRTPKPCTPVEARMRIGFFLLVIPSCRRVRVVQRAAKFKHETAGRSRCRRRCLECWPWAGVYRRGSGWRLSLGRR